ncbi:MAG: lactate permease [Candidatus Aminicenantes bacterium]|nr:lactate permease [Candidatus Aminicenantes bacterium]
MPWNQIYDPLGNRVLSTALASLPVLVLLGALASLKIKAHVAALLGLGSALAVSVLAFGMPAGKALGASLFGAAYGLFPIGWIILNVIFLYNLSEEKGHFKVLRESLTGITGDRRLQLLLIAFSFGAFFEAAAGFGTPVAVTAAILIGLGFSPLMSSGLSLIANTAPVAFGGLGTPIIALAGVTGIDVLKLSAMVGRQLPVFSIIIPFWLVWAYAGFGGMIEVWPALLTAGIAFAVPQFLISNYHGPWLAGIGASVVSIFALIGLLLVWKPTRIWGHEGPADGAEARANHGHGNAAVLRAWLPWLILSAIIFVWGIPQVKAFLDGLFSLKIPVPGVDKLISRVPPVVQAATPERAVFGFNALSFTGTGIFITAIISALIMGYRFREAAAVWRRTLKRVRFSLLTVAAMLALGYVTRYSGLDATLGLAFAGTGVLYPFFGTLLGWLGVALTGSDTSSNVLFGSLQTISAGRLGLNPVLMAAANSSGGVMGKMIDAQSIVVASTATKWYGHEGEILRYVFLHSLALASLVGLLVTLQAYVRPFVHMVVK